MSTWRWSTPNLHDSAPAGVLERGKGRHTPGRDASILCVITALLGSDPWCVQRRIDDAAPERPEAPRSRSHEEDGRSLHRRPRAYPEKPSTEVAPGGRHGVAPHAAGCTRRTRFTGRTRRPHPPALPPPPPPAAPTQKQYAELAGMSNAVILEKTGRTWEDWVRVLDGH